VSATFSKRGYKRLRTSRIKDFPPQKYTIWVKFAGLTGNERVDARVEFGNSWIKIVKIGDDWVPVGKEWNLLSKKRK